MSANAPGIRPQAIVKVVPRGGTVDAHQIRRQIGYITRNGTIPLRRSDRYLDAAPAGVGEFDRISLEWARQAAVYPLRNREDGTRRDLTTHIVVSLPRNTPHQLAEDTMRDYAFEMFGSGRNGGQWDYFTVFHTDRQHPHLHIVVNRLSHEGRWLKISRRDPFMNYDNMRAVVSDVAYSRGIDLDPTSRAERGVVERPVTFAEYRRHRRRTRDGVFIYPQPTNDTPVEPDAIIGPSRTGAIDRRNAAEHGIAERAAAVEQGFVNGQDFQAARQRGRDIAAAAAARARQLFPDPQDDLGDDFGGGGDDNNDDQDDDDAGAGGGAVNNNGDPAGNGQNNNGQGQDGLAPRRRGPPQRSIIETRAQRRLREQQEAARARVDEQRRARAEQAQEAERRRQAREVAPVARTRAQQRELDTLNLRSGTRINRARQGRNNGNGQDR
jgi:type IV secretion system T-DNA border endonuclease VirD2